MAFKMKGNPIKRNFGIGVSPEEIRKEASENVAMNAAMDKKSVFTKKRTWTEAYVEGQKMGEDLSYLTRKRNELRDSGDTSSAEYKNFQDRINKAYGDPTRHSKKVDPKSNVKSKSLEKARPDYQKRRQEARIAKRRGKGGADPIYDIRTDKKEARMKYGRKSKEFQKYKQELKDAKAASRQERRDNK